MEENNSQKIGKLAREVLTLSRNTLLVNLRFLDMALSHLELSEGSGSIAVDGEHLCYDPLWVLRRYKSEKSVLTRDYLHMILHCVFSHPFVSTLMDAEKWDLACDMAVENTIRELMLPCLACSREQEQTAYLNAMAGKVKILTAEKIYHDLLTSKLTPAQMETMRRCFCADDHALWYVLRKTESEAEEDGRDGSESGSGRGSGRRKQNWSDPDNGDSGNADNQSASDSSSNADSDAKGMESLTEMWKHVAQQLQTDLETFSKQRGDRAGSMVQNLKAVTREKYDYSSFLRRFAVYGEAMKINDDEFDTIFYTYGMKLYGRMPLIEPLEYKDVKRIREFVIAIDTSGSVQGAQVQRFLQKTYNILKQTESFFSKINLHIIQCDAEIQQDTRITSQEEFDRFIQNVQLHGFGGTDFRPVFEYVETLQKGGELPNLKGLIYFTDGYGVFPARQPAYHTAFVFVEEGYEIPEVPVWAIRLVLPKEDI